MPESRPGAARFRILATHVAEGVGICDAGRGAYFRPRRRAKEAEEHVLVRRHVPPPCSSLPPLLQASHTACFTAAHLFRGGGGRVNRDVRARFLADLTGVEVFTKRHDKNLCIHIYPHISHSTRSKPRLGGGERTHTTRERICLLGARERYNSRLTDLSNLRNAYARRVYIHTYAYIDT